MKKNRDTIFLHHIFDASDKIIGYLEGRTFENFIKQDMFFDALVRELEIIGEAANNLSEDFQGEHPDIPWERIIGMRNQLIHGYFTLDLQIVWDTLQKDVPKLKEQIKKLI